MDYVVEIENLTHYYGRKKVYENLSFKIPEGSTFGLLGKNGTGKTTTINILNGFLKPKAGTCKIFGEDSYQLSPQTKARVGFLIEGHIQYSFMNIKQIEKFYSAFYPKWDREVYYELMSKLKVLEDQKISRMSAGQRSQVALGLILAQDPDLLILDDYSMGLDAGYRRLFLDYLKEYAEVKKKTIFITSHIIQDLDGFLKDCVILDYSGVVMQTSIDNLKNNFHCYVFYASEGIEFEKDEVVKNFEVIRNKYTLYSFESEDRVKEYLKNKNIPFTDFQEVPMDLEDAFIGLTGKY
jgi:ABC-2 type transport system ATP-binding protein